MQEPWIILDRQAAGGGPEILRALSVTYCGPALHLEQKGSCAHHSGGIFI